MLTQQGLHRGCAALFADRNVRMRWNVRDTLDPVVEGSWAAGQAVTKRGPGAESGDLGHSSGCRYKAVGFHHLAN